MATTYYADIRAAILARIESNWSATPVMWPGVELSTAGLSHYLRVSIVYTEGYQVGSNVEQYTGFVQLDVCARMDADDPQGTKTLTEYVDDVRDLFPRALSLTASGRPLRFHMPTVHPELYDNGWVMQPVRSRFHLQTAPT